MHKLKQIPEDFIVREISDYEVDESGSYAYFVLKKKNYNTLKENLKRFALLLAPRALSQNFVKVQSDGFLVDKTLNLTLESVGQNPHQSLGSEPVIVISLLPA